jgi:hypothetical protein
LRWAFSSWWSPSGDCNGGTIPLSSLTGTMMLSFISRYGGLVNRLSRQAVSQQTQEEGGYEEAAYHQGTGSAHEEAHVEPAILVQSLSGEEGAGEGTSPFGSALPLCKAGVEGPCTLTVTDSSSPKRCASGIEDPTRCRKYWAHHRTGGPTAKDGACTFVGAVGGVFGDFPGAIAAGGACVLLWQK